MLVWIEAERADVSETATRSAFIGLSDHFGGVFNDIQTMFARQGQNWIHVHWEAVDMHHHDCSCARRDLCSDLLHIHVPRNRISIHNDRCRASAHNGGGAGYDS